MDDLPLLDQPPRERADAARNRALVLQAAWRLYNAGGVEALTTDAVAQEAGVGKGTVYRRFRDKSGLVSALLDDREKELQLAMISGPAPLGPNLSNGSPAGPSHLSEEAPVAPVHPAHPARRTAFIHAYLDYVQSHLDLLLASETAAPGARYRLGVYQFWKTHLTLLFAESPDPEFRAYTVLALLDAGLINHLRTEGWSWDRIRAGVEAEAQR
jgi:AcrR family transcriptional regulator